MKKNKKSLIFIIAGLLCIAAALILFVNNILESRRALDASQQVVHDFSAKLEESYGDSAVDFPVDNPNRSMPVFEIDGQPYVGILSIPSLDLELPVSASFDYQTLQSAPCLYSGTVYGGNMVIGAHNYDSHFGRVSSLEPGAEIMFTDAENHRFHYEVYSLETLDPEQVPDLIAYEGTGRELTLFTCNYFGTKRIVVRCSEIQSIAEG